MSTYFPKGHDNFERKWFVVDATGIPVGRLSTAVADILAGKTKPTWTPFLDMGDHVVVINADKAVLTGRKASQKMYRRTTTQPGSMREVRADAMMAVYPARVIESAVKGMLPKTTLGRKQATKLKVYAGPEHPHTAQNPVKIEVEA